MNEYDYELTTRVDRKYKPLSRVIWSGFIAVIIWAALIAGLIAGVLNWQFTVALGFLSLLLPAAAGIMFAQQMIKVGMIEEEEKRMIELGLSGKRKNSADERLSLTDDGELVDYDEYFDQEKSHYTVG